MTAKSVLSPDATRLAGLAVDLYQKIRSGKITIDHFADFVNCRLDFTPKKLIRNTDGYIVLTVVGRNLTGEEEIARLEIGGFPLSDAARKCLLSRSEDSYDNNHRLEDGKVYKVVLVPTDVIRRDSERSIEVIQSYGSRLGYGDCKAGILPRLREQLSDEQINSMGFDYIVGSHMPIKNSDGNPYLLGLSTEIGCGMEPNQLHASIKSSNYFIRPLVAVAFILA